MPPTLGDSSFKDQFGANEWLVDEMYERYLQDPTSVDGEWIALFAELKNSGSLPSQTSSAPRAGTPPIPKSAQAKSVPVAPRAPVNPPTVQQAPQVDATTKVQATPADPIIVPAPVLITPTAAGVEPLRGVSARVVQSMEASLSVPTATSVRVIPAKLLIDNRIVINNHLKRTRGGKISFTHLIAYAMIKAMRAMPEMNSYYTTIDGKPAIGHPEHINLGIAIDLSKPDGTRQLLVPSIKGCE
ncbi:MAG: multifunctional oxoglutarate decarboxylase/oxoglutarate dehydrogenase thiamine pyrophosphate-binding subunit/dihydrolipoyllysine-residue succinyltransferase subunit, partial [Actinobacteria bacterium]|nr:multifunctional oxoglutarate decarboxylase/oxoglutarate dehydrogenase thiamine pyrophosphate-binding subunit/dihydrolipoyllysine-residue succinyltransferase subunit [Actinomycetota bacterium]